MTDVRPSEAPTRWQGWTIPAIEAAIKARREKHAAAIRRGDLAGALAHEGWIDHLLEGHLYLTHTVARVD